MAASAAEDKLAHDIVALDVSGQFPLSDIFVLASVANERMTSSVVDAVMEAMHKAGVKPVRREGERDGRWVLIDFGDIIVHVQHEQERLFYQLERLWKDCPVVPLQLGPPAADVGDDFSADDADGASPARPVAAGDEARPAWARGLAGSEGESGAAGAAGADEADQAAGAADADEADEANEAADADDAGADRWPGA